MQRHGGMIFTGETKELVLVPLCPQLIPLGLCGERPTTNHLSHGTACQDDDRKHCV
jgi:hypothetical protein